MAAAALLLAVVSVGTANAFEGGITFRMISVPIGAVATLADTAKPDEVFGLAIDRVASLPGAVVNEAQIVLKESMVHSRHDDGYVIIDLDTETSWMVMPATGRYVEFTKADGEAMAAMAKAAEQAIRERAASLPPEQRAQLEALMKSRMPGHDAAKTVIEPLGATQVISGMATTGYRLTAGGDTSRGWVTTEREDLARAFQSLERAQAQISPSQRNAVHRLLSERGLPIRVQTISGEGSGRLYQIREITKVESAPVSEELFEIPGNLRKTTPAELMGEATGAPQGQ